MRVAYAACHDWPLFFMAHNVKLFTLVLALLCLALPSQQLDAGYWSTTQLSVARAHLTSASLPLQKIAIFAGGGGNLEQKYQKCFNVDRSFLTPLFLLCSCFRFCLLYSRYLQRIFWHLGNRIS